MDCFFTSLSFLIYYSFFYVYRLKAGQIVIVPTALFVILGLILSIIAFIQYANGHTLISGTYDNPAGLVLTLACISPFVIYNFNKTNYKVVRILYSICFAINGLAIYLSESRTGMIAYLFIIIYPLFQKYKKTLLVSLGLVILLLTFCYKSQSSAGRFFIYKTTLTMMESKTFLLGKGDNAFQKEYMEYQAKQFANEEKNEEYALLAGNTFHPLNEFLLFLVEHGVLFLLAVLFLISYLFRCKWESKASFCCFVVILIFSLFSYPFKYPITIFILAYCLADCNDKIRREYEVKITHIMRYIFMGISICGICYLAIDVRDNALWKEYLTKAELGKYEDSKNGYKKIYPRMKRNFDFMYSYAATMYNAKEYTECLQLLKQTIRLSNNYDTQLLMAKTYEKMEQDTLALIHYKKAAQMCPNRFVPLYGIFKIYNRREDVINRNKIGSEILHKPIKVNSHTVQEIQKNVYDIMNK